MVTRRLTPGKDTPPGLLAGPPIRLRTPRAGDLFAPQNFIILLSLFLVTQFVCVVNYWDLHSALAIKDRALVGTGPSIFLPASCTSLSSPVLGYIEQWPSTAPFRLRTSRRHPHLILPPTITSSPTPLQPPSTSNHGPSLPYSPCPSRPAPSVRGTRCRSLSTTVPARPQPRRR